MRLNGTPLSNHFMEIRSITFLLKKYTILARPLSIKPLTRVGMGCGKYTFRAAEGMEYLTDEGTRRQSERMCSGPLRVSRGGLRILRRGGQRVGGRHGPADVAGQPHGRTRPLPDHA